MIKREPLILDRQHRRAVSFSVACLLGSVTGALYMSRYSVSSVMLLLEYPQMSIVTGAVISALPFIVFYICLRFSAFWLIYPLAFIRMFIFVYCFGGITIAYADAGWLVRYLLLFSDFLSVPLLLWYTATKLLRGWNRKDLQFVACLMCVIAVRCIDSYVISPFAWELLRI